MAKVVLLEQNSLNPTFNPGERRFLATKQHKNELMKHFGLLSPGTLSLQEIIVSAV